MLADEISIEGLTEAVKRFHKINSNLSRKEIAIIAESKFGSKTVCSSYQAVYAKSTSKKINRKVHLISKSKLNYHYYELECIFPFYFFVQKISKEK